MVPIKIISALVLRGKDIFPVVQGLLLGSLITSGFLLTAYFVLRNGD